MSGSGRSGRKPKWERTYQHRRRGIIPLAERERRRAVWWYVVQYYTPRGLAYCVFGEELGDIEITGCPEDTLSNIDGSFRLHQEQADAILAARAAAVATNGRVVFYDHNSTAGRKPAKNPPQDPGQVRAPGRPGDPAGGLQ